MIVDREIEYEIYQGQQQDKGHRDTISRVSKHSYIFTTTSLLPQGQGLNNLAMAL